MKPFFFILLSLILSTIISCTGNDLFDDEVKLTKTTISGNVKLEDQTDHSGIYVWFPLTDKGTYTDADGNFSYTLPSNYKQNGLGYFQFYFYVNDYILQKDSVTIRDGKFEYGIGNLNGDGSLKDDFTLHKWFYIEPFTDNNLPKFNDIVPYMWFKIKFIKPGYVLLPISNSYPFGLKLIYYELSSYFIFDHNNLLLNNPSGQYEWMSFGTSELNGEVLILVNLKYFKTNSLPFDNYKLLPIIYSNSAQIPIELLNNIQADKNNYELYLDFPNRLNKLDFEYSEAN